MKCACTNCQEEECTDDECIKEQKKVLDEKKMKYFRWELSSGDMLTEDYFENGC
jgi:hypothetical protein